jgi:hypothetical protein
VKHVRKLFHRIERILIPSNKLVLSDASDRLQALLTRVEGGEFFADTFPNSDGSKNLQPNRSRHTLEGALAERFIIWDQLWPELTAVATAIISDNPTSFRESSMRELQEEIATDVRVQNEMLEKLRTKDQVRSLQVRLIVN